MPRIESESLASLPIAASIASKALTPALLNPNSVFALRLTSTAISLGWLATIAPL